MSAASSPPHAAVSLRDLAQSELAREPVRYTGALQPDKTYLDGRLPHVVGAHHIQVHRANRSGEGGRSRCTYNHQPYIAWAHERLWLQFLAAPVDEHEAPTCTFVTSSPDGYAWSEPLVAFPEYRLPAFEFDGRTFAAGMSAVMHQRMGFYVAPNGRLLTVGFYGICPDPQHSPNAGNGLGRVVREIRADGTFGEIYFVRYNRHAGFDERNTSYPLYTTARDEGFRAACAALLADPLQTLQWWEEDRGKDGFFALDPSAVAGAAHFDAKVVTSDGAGKAFTWFTRADGVIVALWKNQYSALSADGGRTWTPIVRNRTLRTTGAKTWGQRTSDGRFAIVYNHSATMSNRFPASVLVGDDGRDFPELLCLHGEAPPRRFSGDYKGAGLHYFRGISEGQPLPDGALWVVYSANKEDIWITRAAVPLTSVASAPRTDEFATARTLAELREWNFHLPQWARARLLDDPASAQRVLELRDEEPWDYCQAERVFPATRELRLSFQVQPRELPASATFEIEVQSQQHHRPLRLRFRRGELSWDRAKFVSPRRHFAPGRWYRFELRVDCGAGRWSLAIDGETVQEQIPFGEPTPELARVVFRTGPWRGMVPSHLVDGGGDRPPGLDNTDLPGADTRLAPTVFWVGGLQTDSS